MDSCTYSYGLGIVCDEAAEVSLNGRLYCADHLHLYHPAATDSGHLDDVPGLVLL